MKRFNLSVSCNYWDHIPSAVVDSSDVKLLWNFNIYTDLILAARRPDINVIDKLRNAVQIVDVAVPSDCNVTMKEIEKIEQYQLNSHPYGR